MRVVVTCQAAVGHFHTVAPLARALEEAGHEVTFAVARGFGPWVAQGGFTVVELGPEWLASEGAASRLSDPRRRLRLMSVATGALIDDLRAVLRVEEPDVVLHESLEWAGPLAADCAGVPYAALGQLPRLPQSMVVECMGAGWTAARRRLGLSDDPSMARLHPYLYLDAYLPSMQPLPVSPLDWLRPPQPGVDHLVRPSFFEVGRDRSVPWLADRSRARPLAYATLGSVFNDEARRFAAMIDGLVAAGCDVIATVGERVDPAGFDVDRARVHIQRYLAQGLILDEASLVVSHPGYLTVMAALAKGLPMAVIPSGVDQPYHAHRLAAAGAALVLDPDDLDACGVERAARRLLDEPLFRGNAERLRDELAGLPPLGHAVALLEELAATGIPVTAPAGPPGS